MWHLSKAVGKATLAPPEMARTYLSNPEAAKSLQLYLFDKKELEKLREDILTDPGKYEEVLKAEREHDPFYDDPELPDPGLLRARSDARLKKRDYWYNLLNDGRGGGREEHWEMKVEYHAYAAWAESIQDKALETLKYTVSRLLLDFENDESRGNRVVELGEDPEKSKRASLERLLALLGERPKATTAEVETSATPARGLRDSKRALKDMSKAF